MSSVFPGSHQWSDSTGERHLAKVIFNQLLMTLQCISWWWSWIWSTWDSQECSDLIPTHTKLATSAWRPWYSAFLLVCKCAPPCVRVQLLGSGPWNISMLGLSQGHTLLWMEQAGHARCRQHIQFEAGSEMTTLAATNEQTSMTWLEPQPVGLVSPASKMLPPPVWFRKQASDLDGKGFFSNHSLSGVTALFVFLTLGCRVL